MVKVLKNRGNWLDENIRIIRLVSLSILVLDLITALWDFYFGSFLFFASLIFFSQSGRYKKGIKGEELVEKHLLKLDDTYYLFNDINLSKGYGNIDHVVVGPNGIFVIETKHHRGYIRCNGDEWTRHYPNKYYKLKSFSKQAKGNALKIREVLSSSKVVKNDFFVNSAVVFTNPDLFLKLKNSKVPVVRVGKLNEFIVKKNNVMFSNREVKHIADVILKEAKLGAKPKSFNTQKPLDYKC